MNDVFATINVVPAITFLSYGYFNKGLCHPSTLVLA
jgi:hypothetical protein